MHRIYEALPHFEIQAASGPEECVFPSADLLVRELKLPADTQDLQLVLGYQRAALRAAEQITGLRIRTQLWDIEFDHFPRHRDPLGLPIHPVQLIESVKFYRDGNLETMEAADYLATFGLRPRIQPMPANCWPHTDRRIGAVVVTVKSGIDTSDNSNGFPQQELGDVLADVGQAIILIVRHWWELRGEGKLGMQSETIGDYSYTRAKGDATAEGIPQSALWLLEPHTQAAT